MKKILLMSLILSMLVLAGCRANRPEQQPSQNQTENGSAMQDDQSQNDPMQDGQNDQPMQNEELTAETAQLRALSHAGLKAEEVTRLRSEYDREDKVYEVEFDFDGWEYEYKIHAISGEVFSATQKRIGA